MHNYAKKIMECAKGEVESKGFNGLDDAELCRLEKWVCIGDKMAEYDYYYHITEAMEKPENEYGVNYDERGRFYTPMKNNRMYHDDMMMDNPEYYRDMDRDSKGVMYYSNMPHRSESRYDHARRGYEESKAMHPADDPSNMKAIEGIFDVLDDDMKELKPKMTPSEKSMIKSRLNTLMSML